MIEVSGPGYDARLIQKASFYYHGAENEKALNVLNGILQKNPGSLEALSLRGDVFVQQKKYPEALKDYRSALDLYYRQAGSFSEPPEYLLEMIELVKAQQ